MNPIVETGHREVTKGIFGKQRDRREMSSNRNSVKILKDESGDLAKIVAMGIPESEILGYLVHAHEEQSREKALKTLLAGHSLTGEQVEFVKTVMSRFPL